MHRAAAVLLLNVLTRGLRQGGNAAAPAGGSPVDAWRRRLPRVESTKNGHPAARPARGRGAAPARRRCQLEGKIHRVDPKFAS